MKMDQRRRLSDLYSRGKVFPVLDENGNEALRVYVRKMTPADAEVSYLKASARRAAVLSLGKEETASEMVITLQGQLDMFTRDNLVEWRTTAALVERRPEAEAEVAFQDEWADENYLFSLQERVTQPDFQAKVEETPDDPEVIRIKAELERYEVAVEDKMKVIEGDVRYEFEQHSEAQLRKAILDTMIQAQADSTWLAEFQRCQVWKCIFDAEKHDDPYFASREEVDQVQIEVLQQLFQFIDEVHVADSEGKDSPQTPAS